MVACGGKGVAGRVAQTHFARPILKEGIRKLAVNDARRGKALDTFLL